MRIVLDSNVIIAAFSSRGICNDIMELCLYEYDVYLSEYILKECTEKFKNKLKLPDNVIQNIINYLKNDVNIVIPKSINNNTCRDKKNLPVIGTAAAANAEVIISGDKDLLILKKYKGIKILSPREFWDYLKK